MSMVPPARSMRVGAEAVRRTRKLYVREGWPRLEVAQRRHRIDRCGTSRGDDHCDGGDNREHSRRRGEGQRVPWRDVEHDAGHQLREGRCGRDARKEAGAVTRAASAATEATIRAG